MGATSDNYDIVTSGTTYTIASDYVKPSGGETAHFQMVKLAYGANDSVFYTSASSHFRLVCVEHGDDTNTQPPRVTTA